MVSYPSSSTDRPTNGKPGVGNGNVKAERTPGTPRKDGGVRREMAVQVPELKDYVGSSAAIMANAWYLYLA